MDAMIRPVLALAFCAMLWPPRPGAQESHIHPAPEKLGTVSFPISCQPGVQAEFNRGVALLHSFAYKPADEAFQSVLRQDPHCAIAHWGSAMTHFHQLWDLPPSPADTLAGQKELQLAVPQEASASQEISARERGFLHAAAPVFNDAASVPYSTRALHYEAAMRDLAAANPHDVESQVFYALALISNAPPTDREHRRQKQALALLEPLYRHNPDHPGIPHFLIHACDSQELAPRGLAAARAYAGIAPSAPHALHMPSHIFTRLGLWDDSVHSNLDARRAAEHQGDTGEELHAMDYLVYAYLQSGRDGDAAQVIQQLKSMNNLHMGEFKTGYAATAMPARYVVERRQWDDATRIADPPAPALPQVVAIAAWSRGLGFARTGHPAPANHEADTLRQLEEQLHTLGNAYWATQVNIMRREVEAWSAQASHQPEQAATILRGAADLEDGIEKLPLTPGPIVPAREQLGELLLEQGNPVAARKEYQTAALNSPGRRNALQGQAQARQLP